MDNEEEKATLNYLLKEGVFHLQNKDPKLAIKKFEKILLSRPDNSQVLNLNCIAYHQLGDLSKAFNSINKAIKHDPNEIGFHINLGNIMKDLKNFSDSKKAYENALKINNRSVEAIYNIGVIYTAQHKYIEAITYYKKVIKIDSTHKYAFDNLGNAYMELAEFVKAINYFKKAISIDQDFNQAHHNMSFVLLLTNSIKLGWEKYEYRLKKDTYTNNQPFTNYKYWDGSNLKNKCLLIYCEQGIGDNIQFARYIKKIKKNNTKIVLLCNKDLLIFFENILEIDFIITSHQEIEGIDYYISLMSLPYIFRNNHNTPKSYKFFKPDKQLNFNWKSKIDISKKMKIGLAWQGGLNHPSDYKRSILLKKMKPILDIQDVEFISLQKDNGKEQIKLNKFEKLIIDFFDNIDSFRDTLSIIENLDLVISVDTAIAHIAATMEKETWILLPFVPDFRWGLNNTKTTWYNNVRLFRQKNLNQWDPVITEVKKELLKKII